jgi:hypothetical protein
MLAPTNNSSRKTAPSQPGIFNRKRRPTPPISMITFFNLLSLIFYLVFCQRSTEPLEKALPEQEFTLAVESAEVTEVWLKLLVQPLDERISYLVQRGDTHTVFSGKLLKHDTLLHDFNLQPARDYEYKAYRLVDGHKLPPPVIVTTTTMDTTSHDFTWQIFEFGEKGSSVFYDVAIIDENNIWAVGEILTADTYTYDSLGNFIQPYNAAHWDGERWELKRIQFKGNPVEYPRILSLLTFSENDIWFTNGGSFVHFDGNSYKYDFSVNPLLNGYLTKLWGTDKANIYAIGINGTIVHYNGVSWRRIESSTNLGLTDIWGGANNKIYTVGLNYGQALGVVLKYNGHAFQKLIEGYVEGNGYNPSQLFKTQLYGLTEGVWLDEHGTVYTVGNLMYQYKRGKWDFVRTLPENFLGGDPDNTYRAYLHAIRGNASNDIFIFGESETLIHFNGLTWKRLGPPYLPWSYNFWYNGDVKGNLAVGVGKTAGAARIIKLWR